MKTIIKKIPDDEVYYNWEEEVADLTEVKDDLVIIGDRHHVIFGNSEAVDIAKGDYYDDDEDPNELSEVIGYNYETIPELNKVCGGDWEETTFKGYSQGDWCQVFYNKEKVSEGLLEELEVFIMGKVDGYRVYENGEDDPTDCYIVYVPHDVCWKGKQAICEFLGIKAEDAVVLEDDGYTKVYNYKEMK